MTTQNADDPLARAAADLKEAQETTARVARILAQVDRELEELEGGEGG